RGAAPAATAARRDARAVRNGAKACWPLQLVPAGTHRADAGRAARHRLAAGGVRSAAAAAIGRDDFQQTRRVDDVGIVDEGWQRQLDGGVLVILVVLVVLFFDDDD